VKHITFVLDDDTYLAAERKARALNTSVAEIAAHYIRQWTNEAESLEPARQRLKSMFDEPTRQFAVGTPDDRSLRNAR
jgi:hypothetical protein